ncbi:hypothetical protein IQ251_11920 [Saccharopolyspora sp. HNM0983]|uniref:Uncharacterized protein n=1 Tax=Saccharopolyspora montiporae TaxID=2781240 RepID=A0A929B8E2_9PSEU|nr:hypothetical protein [Saccharopolyspora sp. HNM0983]MBE9375149.1 hypothetical protein [Saccharopolyspora sp. HNM0983]
MVDRTGLRVERASVPARESDSRRTTSTTPEFGSERAQRRVLLRTVARAAGVAASAAVGTSLLLDGMLAGRDVIGYTPGDAAALLVLLLLMLTGVLLQLAAYNAARANKLCGIGAGVAFALALVSQPVVVSLVDAPAARLAVPAGLATTSGFALLVVAAVLLVRAFLRGREPGGG